MVHRPQCSSCATPLPHPVGEGFLIAVPICYPTRRSEAASTGQKETR